MKKLTYYFLLFSTAVFSQNYQYALEEVKKMPGAPTDLVVNNVTSTSADLKWTASANASFVADYRIYSKTGLLANSNGKNTSYTVTGLSPETTYSLTVKASDTDGNLTADSNTQTFTTTKEDTGVKNQPEEIEYFKAYLLPLAQKANLQSALDTYGAVRLEAGDYNSSVNLIMRSNQSLYGHPSLTRVPNITILAGSTNVNLEYLKPAGVGGTILFQAGGVISGCTIKSIKYVSIVGTNVMLENNSLIDINGTIYFDCSQSGYFRNNKVIKHQAQTDVLNLIMKGNSSTPSYGNVNLHANYLTPYGDATDIDGLQSATFIGIDSEGWNLNGIGKKAMFYAQNMGRVKLVGFGGGNGYSAVRTPICDISADEVYWFNSYNSTPASILSTNANLFAINSGGDGDGKYTRKSGAVTGFDLYAHLNVNKLVTYNGVSETATLTNSNDITKITNSILGTHDIPWTRPTFEILPDPLGANWKTDRMGKPDQTIYIQNLIDANGVADLPEGVFYISSTLNIPLDGGHGITGKGTGKTVIVGLTDEFPLITLGFGSTAAFTLSYLTLQGGSVGVFSGEPETQIAYQNMKYVVFRDQNYGIQFHQIFGVDNNFLEHLGFVNCNIGIFQDALMTSSDVMTSSYMDKTVWYKCQFINCNVGVSMIGTRANNLDAWIDCKFDGGQSALILGGQNMNVVANCDFTNYSGKNVILSTSINMYSCNLFNNSVTEYTINSVYSNLEGCNLSDNSTVFAPVEFNPTFQYILNSTIVGNVVVNRPTNNYYLSSAIYVNSRLSSNPSLSKLFVNVKEGVPTVLIDKEPDPYPQLLVKQ